MNERISLSKLIDGSRIHGSVYRDEAIYESELDRIWKREWVYIGHESQVPGAGDFLRTQIVSQPLLMVRGKDMKLRVFYNRCRHRANLVCFEKHGTASSFVCPYHGWSFSLGGELLQPTFDEGYDYDLERGDFPLIEVERMGVYRGLVFASLSRHGKSLEDHLGQAREYLDLIADLSPTGEIELSAGSQKTEYNGNWKYMPENSMEGDYHGPFLHKVAFEIFEEQTGFDVGSLTENEIPDVIQSLPGGHMVEDYRKGDAISMPERPSEARLEYIRDMEKNHGPERAKGLLNTIAPLLYVWPNLIYVMTHFRHLVPDGPNKTTVHYTPHLFGGVQPEINASRLRAHEFMFGPAGFVAPDDVEIMERNQVAMGATGDEWLFIGRGSHRENVLSDGGTRGYTMDENHLRGFWRYYSDIMNDSSLVDEQVVK